MFSRYPKFSAFAVGLFLGGGLSAILGLNISDLEFKVFYSRVRQLVGKNE